MQKKSIVEKVYGQTTISKLIELLSPKTKSLTALNLQKQDQFIA